MSLRIAIKNCAWLALRGQWRTALYHIHNRLHGLDLRFASVSAAGLSEALSNWYADSGGPKLDRLLRTLAISPSDQALDVGCGKGGAMITLARQPFRRVDGVELSEALVKIARENLRKLGIAKASVFHCDAAEFKHFDPYTFLYLSNPFPRTVMTVVTRNLAASLENSPRRMVLIYYNPVDRDLFEDLGFEQVNAFQHDENPTFVFVREPRGCAASDDAHEELFPRSPESADVP